MLYCKKSLADKDDCGEYEITREETIKTIKELMIACTPDSKYYNVGKMAIKALEQDPCDDIKNIKALPPVAPQPKTGCCVSDVLDKIRSEIADLMVADVHGDYRRGFNDALIRVAQIINKYKEEKADRKETDDD